VHQVHNLPGGVTGIDHHWKVISADGGAPAGLVTFSLCDRDLDIPTRHSEQAEYLECKGHLWCKAIGRTNIHSPCRLYYPDR